MKNGYLFCPGLNLSWGDLLLRFSGGGTGVLCRYGGLTEYAHLNENGKKGKRRHLCIKVSYHMISGMSVEKEKK